MLLEGLTPAQIEAVTAPGGPLCVLASAGAGKTRVLTRRVAYRVDRGDASACHVLALTFTRKAAGELADRLRHLGLRERIAAGTFHAMAAAQLRRWWADCGAVAPNLVDRKARLLAPLATARPRLADVPVAELAVHIDWAQARLISPDGFVDAARRAGRVLPVAASELADLYRRYEDEKRRRRVIDFDDLLAGCADVLEREPAFAAAQRWRWRHVFVDEFQDLNPLQHRLLLAWLGSNRDLSVVGDPHQAIYGWNGADPYLLARFPGDWPDATVVRLDANHRCTPQIVAAAAGVLGTAGRALTSVQADGAPLDVRDYPTDAEEANGVAAQVASSHRGGTPLGQLAVLARTNAQLPAFRKALERVGVPVRMSGTATMLDHPAAARALTALRQTPAQPLQVARADLQAAARDVSRSDEERAVLGQLADLAIDYASTVGQPTTGSWLAWLPAAVADDARGPADMGSQPAVTLCSFHRAKGLEWDEAWISGLEEGLVPIGRAASPASEAEERRLLYVALTRAARRLHATWARRRSFGGRTVPRQPSPWLEALHRATRGDPPEAVATVSEWRDRLRAQRDALRSRRHERGVPVDRADTGTWPEPDSALLAALRAWRAHVSRTSGVPAHVVLHDRTLDALAVLAPRTEAELLEVPGLGPVKATRFGSSILTLIAEREAAG